MKRKKILIYGLTSMIGGVETYIINLVQNIDKTKFEIDFLVQDEIEGINKEKIKDSYNNIHFVENYKKHPIKAFKTLKKIYKKNKYDVIHLNISTASSCMYALPSKFYSKNTKILIHSHNGGTNNKLQHFFFRKILRIIADEILACSDIAAEWMYGKKISNSGKVIITNNAIQTKKFIYDKKIRDKIRNELKIENDFVIGHIGRFNEQKNHFWLINLFKKLSDEEDNLKLILLGTGELEDKVKKMVQSYKLEDKVLFLGVKSNVNDYYQAMDLFVLPSIFEGLPIVSIEAQASGLKCLLSSNVTKEANITENVEFISISDDRKWIDRIKEIRNNSYERKNMYDIIKSRGYDLTEEIRKIEDLYYN